MKTEDGKTDVRRAAAGLKTVWITGASSGIGEALSREYNSRGAFVVLSARRADVLQTVRQGLEYPERALIWPLDVTDFDNCADITGRLLNEVGSIDMFINVAGIDYKIVRRLEPEYDNPN